MSKLEQALLSLAIRLGVMAGLAFLDIVAKNVTGLGLPDPAVTIPLASLFVSEADTWLVNWAGKNNIPTSA